MFSRPQAARIADRWIPVKLRPDDPNPRLVELRGMHLARWAPSLLVLDPAGDVVLSELGSLLPVMTHEGLPAAGTEDQIPTLEGILARLEEAEAAHLSATRSMERLQGRSDPDARAQRAVLLEARGRWPQAQAEWESAYEVRGEPQWGEALADLLARRGERARALQVLGDLLRLHPDHPRSTQWQVRHLLLDADHKDLETDARLARLLDLQQEIEASGRPPVARLHIEIAHVRARLGDVAGVKATLAWFQEYGASVELEAATLFSLASLSASVGDYDAAIDYLNAVVRRFPASPEAEDVKHGMIDSMRRQRSVNGSGRTRVPEDETSQGPRQP